MFYIVLVVEDEQGNKTNDITYQGKDPFITSIHLAAMSQKLQLEEWFPKAKYQVAEVTLLFD